MSKYLFVQQHIGLVLAIFLEMSRLTWISIELNLSYRNSAILQKNKTLSKFVKMEDEKVIVDETLVLKFEDSTQPSKRIKQEPTDPDAKESKVIVDAMKQTETFDTDLKVQIATQTDRPLIYSCICCYEKFRSSEKFVSLKMNFL